MNGWAAESVKRLVLFSSQTYLLTGCLVLRNGGSYFLSIFLAITLDKNNIQALTGAALLYIYYIYHMGHFQRLSLDSKAYLV